MVNERDTLIETGIESDVLSSRIDIVAYHPDKRNPILNKLAVVSMTAFRLMLCPGDDVLVVTSAVAIGINDRSEHQAALPYRGSQFTEGEEDDLGGSGRIKVLFLNPLY